MAAFILTVIGADRPGLVRALADAVAARGGSWLESRMARMAGQFAGIVRVEAPEALEADLRALAHHGLQITVERSEPRETAPGEALLLEVVGNDRPGIVREIAAVIAGCGVNIEELTTGIESASFAGGVLFRATMALRAPDSAAMAAVRAGLERLGDELMVDIRAPADS